MEGRIDYSLISQVATALGDRWLCADSVAVLLGMFTPAGQPDRRGFLVGPARHPNFPSPLALGSHGAWRKTEVERWAEDEHRIQHRERAVGRPTERSPGAAGVPARDRGRGVEASVGAPEIASAVAGGAAIPFELRAIDADGVAALIGLSPRTVLEKVACRPGFPVRLTARPATWVAGEVLAWRESNKRIARKTRAKRPHLSGTSS